MIKFFGNVLLVVIVLVAVLLVQTSLIRGEIKEIKERHLKDTQVIVTAINTISKRAITKQPFKLVEPFKYKQGEYNE